MERIEVLMGRIEPALIRVERLLKTPGIEHACEELDSIGALEVLQRHQSQDANGGQTPKNSQGKRGVA